MDRSYKKKDNGVNEAAGKELTESRPARDGVGHPRSSACEILTTKEGKKKRPLKVGCWNVRITSMFRAGKLENVKFEMTRLGINIMGISETRWPGENEYYSDQFNHIIIISYI